MHRHCFKLAPFPADYKPWPPFVSQRATATRVLAPPLKAEFIRPNKHNTPHPKSSAGATEFAGLGGKGYKLPRAEYAPKHTSNTPCYFSNTLELVNSYVNSQMKRCLPEECVYSQQVATCEN